MVYTAFLNSVAERLAGSTPATRTKQCANSSAGSEQRPSKTRVGGSNPSWRTTQQGATVTARNDITGDSIQSKASTDAYADNWDRIFGKKKADEQPTEPEQPVQTTQANEQDK